MANEDLSKLKIDKSQAMARPRVRKRRFLLAGGAVLVAIVIALYLSGVLSPAPKVDAANVVQMYPSQTFTLLNATGYVVPQRKAAVASKNPGRIISLSVEEGSRVKKGDIIARLENEDLIAQKNQTSANLDVARYNLEQTKAELHDATQNYQREKNLLAKEFTTRASYDAAEARYRKALANVSALESTVKANKAALQGAEVSLDYTLIRAPFDAVVLTKNADIGDLVTPVSGATSAKAAVVTVADMDSLQVEADVSESSIKEVSVGQPCEIQLDAIPDTRFPGVIHMIVPTADRSKATVMVKVRFLGKDPRILPEMSAKVAFLAREVKEDEKKPRVALTSKAVREKNGTKTVLLVKGNRIHETVVVLGKPIGDMIEVESGVKPGDRVVINPPKTLRDGSTVKLVEK
jgi:RND family efflux transporter MFP subunit